MSRKLTIAWPDANDQIGLSVGAGFCPAEHSSGRRESAHAERVTDQGRLAGDAPSSCCVKKRPQEGLYAEDAGFEDASTPLPSSDPCAARLTPKAASADWLVAPYWLYQQGSAIPHVVADIGSTGHPGLTVSPVRLAPCNISEMRTSWSDCGNGSGRSNTPSGQIRCGVLRQSPRPTLRSRSRNPRDLRNWRSAQRRS